MTRDPEDGATFYCAFCEATRFIKPIPAPPYPICFACERARMELWR